MSFSNDLATTDEALACATASEARALADELRADPGNALRVHALIARAEWLDAQESEAP